jgi:alcohol dehydrogenase
VDADLSMTMPARLTAVTGFDALSHAMETMWNTGHTEASDALAKEALGLVMANLATAVEEPANAEARLAMARAATLAGQGISYTTTAAAHAISYPLTLFHGIDHGIACSITLPALLRLNAQADASRTAHILDAMHVASVNEGVDALRALFEHCGMPTTLAELGVEERDLERLVANAFDPARMGNNIRPLTEAEVRRLLAQLL